MMVNPEEMDLTSAELSKMSADEQKNLMLQIRDIKTDTNMIFQHYSKLHMMNYEDFSTEVMKNMSNVDNFVNNSEFEARRFLQIKNKQIIIAEQGKVPKNPFTDAVRSSEEGIKNLITVITWQRVALDVLFTGWEKIMSLVGEYKTVQHDKIKSDLERDNRESLLKQQKEMYDNILEQFKKQQDEINSKMKEQIDDERKHSKEMLEQLMKITTKVNEIDREADQRYTEQLPRKPPQPLPPPQIVPRQETEEERRQRMVEKIRQLKYEQENMPQS